MVQDVTRVKITTSQTKQDITEERLIYWEKRANEVKSPLLIGRYAGLVIDFSDSKFVKKSINVDLTRKVIDSNIKIVENNLVSSVNCKNKIKRALVLAIKIKDEERKEKVKEVILKYEDKSPNWIVFPFECFLLNYDYKIKLKEEEKRKIISDLEKFIEKESDHFESICKPVTMFAKYYHKKEDEENLIQVLSKLEKAVEKDEIMKSHLLSKQDGYLQTAKLYQEYKKVDSVKKAYTRILIKIINLKLDPEKYFTKMTIEVEEDKEIVDYIFGKGDKEHELSRVLKSIGLKFILKKTQDKTDEKKTGKFFIKFYRNRGLLW